MRYRLSRLALIATAALLWTGCSVQRTAVSRSEELRTTELRSTESRDSVTIELRDTLKEVTTITIDRNDAGDTLRVTQVTDRDRSRSMYDVRCKTEVVRVERDTVYVERKDSVLVQSSSTSEATKSMTSFQGNGGQENAYKEVIKTAVGGAAGVIHQVDSATMDCQPNENVEALRVFMLDKKIEARPTWKPMHKQPVYAGCDVYTNGIEEELFKVGFCLPAGPYVTDEDVRYIVESIKEAIVG